MTYRDKYIKYKTKYLTFIKNQHGGIFEFDGNCLQHMKNLFIPCEIQNITKKIFYDSELSTILFELIAKLSRIDGNIHHTLVGYNLPYFQDPVILFNDKNNNDYQLLIVNQRNYIPMNLIDNERRFSFDETYYSNPLGQYYDFGGNFISSPIFDDKSCILCYDGLTTKLENFIMCFTNQELIKLKCSFTSNGYRHIDECYCFMPYGSTFKIWSYHINDISYKNELKLIVNDERCNLTLKIKEIERTIDEKLEKSANDFTKQSLIKSKSTLLRLTNYINNMHNPESISFAEYYKKDRVLLRRSLDIIPDGFTCFRKFFKNELFGIIVNKNELILSLQNEQRDNLDKISNALFKSPYNSNTDKFVLFPINLSVDVDKNFSFDEPPLFNRLWIETKTQCLCVLPLVAKINKNTLQIIENEKKLIKSMLNQNTPTEYIYVDTNGYHISGSAGSSGGNVHCLVKQLFD